MADTLPNIKRSDFAKKLIKKYGKNHFKKMGLKGWEVRKDIMLERVGYVRENI